MPILNLGDALYFLGKYEEAISAFERVILNNPKNFYALKTKGKMIFSTLIKETRYTISGGTRKPSKHLTRLSLFFLKTFTHSKPKVI